MKKNPAPKGGGIFFEAGGIDGARKASNPIPVCVRLGGLAAVFGKILLYGFERLIDIVRKSPKRSELQFEHFKSRGSSGHFSIFHMPDEPLHVLFRVFQLPYEILYGFRTRSIAHSQKTSQFIELPDVEIEFLEIPTDAFPIKFPECEEPIKNLLKSENLRPTQISAISIVGIRLEFPLPKIRIR